MRRPEAWFADEGDERWPVGPADLEEHYEAVEAELGAGPYPWADATPKTRRFREAADLAGVGWREVDLAVSFAAGPGMAPEEGVALHGPRTIHGRERSTCRRCGECDVGCNFGAKNTLDHTYLTAAHRAGADIRTLCDVVAIEPAGGGDGAEGWIVRYRVHDGARTGHLTEPDDGAAVREAVAATVILAAGTFGTQLLLRRNANRLPGLSPRLGDGISANGDLLTFAARCDPAQPLHPHDGPVITTAVEHIDGTGGFYLEDAGFPAIGEWLFHAIGAAEDLWHDRRELLRLAVRGMHKKRDANLSAELAGLAGRGATSSCTMPLLGMGRDVADGRLGLDDERRLTCDWAIDASRPFFEELLGTAGRIAEALGGELWDTAIGELDRIVTVHPLGGCRMGADATLGVVDGWGAVHGCRGLYVCDGSVMPGAVGANPSLTIAAFGERVAAGINAAA
ncbi:MAG: cholesterol oxidase [Solirubrobacteraceae bacterium]|jgi:cholesterol oxidase|nr:cholesterol oxidase [Solirubrobacteraceae bacterium]